MEASTLSAIKELGIAIVSVLSVSYILYTVIISLRQEHQQNQEWFKGFVLENNHQKTEMIREHTKAMVEVGKNIELNTKTIEHLINKFDK